MKSKIIYLIAVVVMASCSSPKYAYYFDHHYYNHEGRSTTSVSPVITKSPLAIKSTELIGSNSNTIPAVVVSTESEKFGGKTYAELTKSERKSIRSHIRNEIKSIGSEKRRHSTMHTSEMMDNDLKLAAIFGSVGVVGLIIGGSVFNVVGAISLLIGVVFFVKWLIRQ